jgi:hypothetical protein
VVLTNRPDHRLKELVHALERGGRGALRAAVRLPVNRRPEKLPCLGDVQAVADRVSIQSLRVVLRVTVRDGLLEL